MNKLPVTLRQHTPLIHFQYAEPGATLRATEFKPRFDAYLAEKAAAELQGEHFLKDTSGEKEIATALDYKLRIKAGKEVSFMNDLDVNLFSAGKREAKNNLVLANMGKEKNRDADYKDFSFHETVDLVFTTYHDDLREIIKTHLYKFLSTNNFGNRQTKGFGSFYIDEDDDLYEDYFVTKYYIDLKNIAFSDQNILFGNIELLWKIMKSGLNRQKWKFSPLILTFFKKHGIDWEKGIISNEFFNKTYDSKGLKTNMIKPFLGLSTSEEWKINNKSWLVEKEHQPISEETSIERFKSPITFKPLYDKNIKGFLVNLVIEDWPNEIFNQNFEVSIKDKAQSYNHKNSKKLTVKTPQKTDKITLVQFFEYIMLIKKNDLMKNYEGTNIDRSQSKKIEDLIFSIMRIKD